MSQKQILTYLTHRKRWLVVLTILKNISKWEGLSHILWKIKNVPNHQPEKIYYVPCNGDIVGSTEKYPSFSKDGPARHKISRKTGADVGISLRSFDIAPGNGP